MTKEFKVIVNKYVTEYNCTFLGKGGKHYKIKHNPSGKTLTFSCTPSDINAHKQFDRHMLKVINGVYDHHRIAA